MYVRIPDSGGIKVLSEDLSKEEIIAKYTGVVEPLFSYIPWLEEKVGTKGREVYDLNGLSDHSLSFPVYDATLLNFVKVVSKTEMMNRNYAYVYSWNRLRTVEDELRFIRNANLYEIDALFGILSRYVLGGMTKGNLWSQAVEKGIFLEFLLKMKELLDYWEQR